MARLTLLQAAAYVAHQSAIPMTAPELWQAIVAHDLHTLVRCTSKTPDRSVGAMIYIQIRDDPEPFFKQVSSSPPQFELIEGKTPVAAIERAIQALRSSTDGDKAGDQTTGSRRRLPFKERDTHPFLSHFAHHHMDQLYTRTIHHETSQRRYGQWVHPDIVGFRFPFGKGHNDLIRVMGGPDKVLTLASFELKRNLHLANLRESFFQAVSNSSWAHEGYLVASIVDKSPLFMTELHRLSTSFGIGVIELCLNDPSQSSILLPAAARSGIDFTAANKLANENPDFSAFLRNVRIDVDAGYIHVGEYDAILSGDDLIKRYNNWIAASPPVPLPLETHQDLLDQGVRVVNVVSAQEEPAVAPLTFPDCSTPIAATI